MNEADEALRQMLRRWKPPPAPSGLAERVVRHAIGHAQEHPPGQKLVIVVARTFTEWRYALAFKAAVLATCVVAGIAVGQLSLTAAETDLLALALAEDTWAGAL